ncbi:MAG TPA: hypothetical protein DEH15_15405 [Marinilabiliales bacterium]|nr:hypothetical protein [Marinilabiliales bacterium]
MGEGILSVEQPPNDNIEIPAVVAAETLIKLRRVKGYFSDLLIFSGFSWLKLRNNFEETIRKFIQFYVDPDKQFKI